MCVFVCELGLFAPQLRLIVILHTQTFVLSRRLAATSGRRLSLRKLFGALEIVQCS